LLKEFKRGGIIWGRCLPERNRWKMDESCSLTPLPP